jgi:hypothetical protein
MKNRSLAAIFPVKKFWLNFYKNLIINILIPSTRTLRKQLSYYVGECPESNRKVSGQQSDAFSRIPINNGTKSVFECSSTYLNNSRFTQPGPRRYPRYVGLAK